MHKYILLLILTIVCCTEGLSGGESLVAPIFLNRHSGTAYDPAREVSQEQLRALVEAARWAPSSHNDQPWNFIICDRTHTLEMYEKVLSTLKGHQQPWVQKASLLVVVTARSHLIYKNKFNEWAEYDTGAAAISMALEAADLGLMAHQIGGFDKEQICEIFQLPDNVKPMTIMAIGYEAEPDALPRERSPVAERFFLGEWGKPLFNH
jgi:nitroreductase